MARDVAEARNAEVDAKRRTQLLAQGFVSRDEYDQSQTRAASLAAAVKADEAAVENARLQLQYCYIHSPIDGRVGQLLVHEGNVVEANDTLLAVINQVRPVYVSFSVPEQDLPEVRQRAARRQAAGASLRAASRRHAHRRRPQLHQQHGRHDHRHRAAQGVVSER